MIAYLSLSSLLPVAFAIGYGEPVWPFVGAGALAGGVGLGLDAARPSVVGTDRLP